MTSSPAWAAACALDIKESAVELIDSIHGAECNAPALVAGAALMTGGDTVAGLGGT